MMNLTHMDFKRLMQEPSANVRGTLAAKIAMDYRAGNFSRAEAAIADDIFRILLKDVERKVRQKLSEQLCHCPNAPHDVIAKLAEDESDVAVHVLEYSQVLTEDDLIAIVKSTQEVLKWCAVARRDNISESLSEALIDTHNEMTLSNLFRNKGAAIAERSLEQAWDYVSSNHALLETLVSRGGLPLTIAEKLFFLVSDDLKRQLSRTYKLSTPMIHKAANDAREWEMLGIMALPGMDDPNDDERVEDLTDQLYLSGRLTHSLLIRALCMGCLNLFEAGIARLAGVPRVNARILLMDSGTLGFNAIYKSASMPEGFAEAVQTLLKISLEETDFGLHKRLDFRKRVIDKIYVGGYHRSVENMEYLLSIVGGKIAPASVH